MVDAPPCFFWLAVYQFPSPCFLSLIVSGLVGRTYPRHDPTSVTWLKRPKQIGLALLTAANSLPYTARWVALGEPWPLTCMDECLLVDLGEETGTTSGCGHSCFRHLARSNCSLFVYGQCEIVVPWDDNGFMISGSDFCIAWLLKSVFGMWFYCPQAHHTCSNESWINLVSSKAFVNLLNLS